MDPDTLIQTIVERVITQLQESSNKNTTQVLVFGAYSQQVEQHILKCVCATDVELCYWDTNDQYKEAERYIIPQLSCRDMADLALGKAKGPMAEMVLRLLLEGKAVEVIDYEYKAYEKTASPALYKLYLQHESTLSSFGLKCLKPDPEPVLRFWQKLITEKDVERAAQNSVKEIQVAKDCVITPLAADQAKSNRIDIKKEL
ncbi:hypothetical protein L3Q72_10705 [Vibrio sp. JC009]|uniref:hypothetical protein n=1 Tax=Vibrio sp. JC009 TaxID=2912314 RepID=UPI0023B17F30|nr:hypothetical protein [Vibrio sp. JC009]WED21108.1 hypothetical protein L3Q72_10705 [Vibrio sp. JC009]